MVKFESQLPRLIATRNDLQEVPEKRFTWSKEAASVSRTEIYSSYRSLIKTYGWDPSKRKPSSERLRAMLLKDSLDLEHPALVAMALVSAASGIVLSGFDRAKLVGQPRMGSYVGEVELIDGTTITLEGKEVVIVDDEKPLSVVPYMDTTYAKIDESTKEAIFVPHLVFGIPAPLALRSLRRLKDILSEIGAQAVLEL